MIYFIVDGKKIECQENETILDLKTKIIKECNLKTKYIDLDFKLDKPIRALGKFNLENGLLSRVMDNYKFDRFNLDEKQLNLNYIECPNYTPIIKKDIKPINTNKYKFDSSQNEIKYVEEKTFNLNSDLEFPKLGS